MIVPKIINVAIREFKQKMAAMSENWDTQSLTAPLTQQVAAALKDALTSAGAAALQAFVQSYNPTDPLLQDDDAPAAILRSLDYYRHRQRLGQTRREALAAERTFFSRNQQRMTYASFRRRRLPIGNGPVEAACKTLVKTRLCRSGMRWSRVGGQRILSLRTYVKSQRWDNFWHHYLKLRQSA